MYDDCGVTRTRLNKIINRRILYQRYLYLVYNEVIDASTLVSRTTTPSCTLDFTFATSIKRKNVESFLSDRRVVSGAIPIEL